MKYVWSWRIPSVGSEGLACPHLRPNLRSFGRSLLPRKMAANKSFVSFEGLCRKPCSSRNQNHNQSCVSWWLITDPERWIWHLPWSTVSLSGTAFAGTLGRGEASTQIVATRSSKICFVINVHYAIYISLGISCNNIREKAYLRLSTCTRVIVEGHNIEQWNR